MKISIYRCTLLIILTFSQMYIAKVYGQDRFINFNSTQEKEFLTQAENNKNLLKLSLLADIDEITADKNISLIDSYIKQLNWSHTDHSKPTKKLKALFKNIHTKFLRIYEEDANVHDMFESGKYNCVTASILYSYIFEDINIPYQIKEEPTHVYVIAYPNQHNIMIETTIPTTGVFAPNTKAKTDYIKALVANKYLEQSYVDQVGVEKAFNEFFYGNDNISFKQLVGITYYNKSISNLNDADYKNAYSNMAKTVMLYQAKKHSFLKQTLLEEIADDLDIKVVDNWNTIVEISRNSENEKTNKFILNNFYHVTDLFLWKNHKQEILDSIYNIIEASSIDTALKQEIKYSYNFEVARSYFDNKKYNQAEKYLLEIYTIKKDAPVTQNLIKNILFASLGRYGNPNNIDKLDRYKEKFLFLANDIDLKSAYIYNYAYLTYENYRRDDMNNGLNYYYKMVTELENFDGESHIPDEMMENIFTLTAGQFVMKNQKQKAKDILAKGAKLFPHIKKFKDTISKIN